MDDTCSTTQYSTYSTVLRTVSTLQWSTGTASNKKYVYCFIFVSFTMAEEMNEEEIMNEQAPDVTMPSFTIYIPDFVPEYGLSEQSVEEQKNELIRKDWLTSGLIQEIESLLPTRSDINVDEDNKRDPAAFERNIAQLFPPGRIFASSKQLDVPRCLGCQEGRELQKHPVCIFCKPSYARSKACRPIQKTQDRTNLEVCLQMSIHPPVQLCGILQE